MRAQSTVTGRSHSPLVILLLLALSLVFTACSVVGAGRPTPTPTLTVPSDPAPGDLALVTPTPEPSPTPVPPATPTAAPEPTPTPLPTPTPQPTPVPDNVFLEPMSHEFQTWNNCAAVSAAMVLSYFGIQRTQAQLGPLLRPNSGDKHVEPHQLVRLLEQFGLRARVLEGGSLERIEELVAAGFPVITPQWLDHKPDAIGHYRVVRGFDRRQGVVFVNDSMIGAGVAMPYAEFEELWRAFAFRYIPVYRPEDEPRVLAILGEDADPRRNVERANQLIRELVAQHPDDAYLWFSLGTTEYLLGNIDAALAAYERAAAIGLPPKMLWYQFWPVSAFVDAGQYQRALELAAAQIASAGVFGEMHYERGRAFEALGQTNAAIAEYRRALDDDANLQAARDALARLGVQP